MWGQVTALSPHQDTTQDSPSQNFSVPTLGGDTERGQSGLGCESVISGVISPQNISPCALSLQTLPRESDGKPGEGRPCWEDDSHGSQPVSTSCPCSWHFSPGHFLQGLCSLSPSRPTPQQHLCSPGMGCKTPSRARQRHGLALGDLGMCGLGLSMGFWGVSPSQICFFQ